VITESRLQPMPLGGRPGRARWLRPITGLRCLVKYLFLRLCTLCEILGVPGGNHSRQRPETTGRLRAVNGFVEGTLLPAHHADTTNSSGSMEGTAFHEIYPARA
jgi:hypothetical protein